MTKSTIIFIENQWYSCNITNPGIYQENHEFGKDDIIITFQSQELIRHLKNIKQFRNWPDIIDLESFDKQMTQEGKDLRPHKKWSVLESLKYHNIAEPDFKLSKSTIKQFLGYMGTLYNQLLENKPEEKERFTNLETRVNKIIYRRQRCGIPVDMTLAESLCSDLEQQIFHIKNILQVQHRIFNPDNEQWQLEFLKAQGYRLIKSPLFTFKAWRNDNEICNLMYEMIRNQKDFDSLLFMQSHWGGRTVAFPKFIGFGTITSRIILREPSFQNLRKSNRKVVVANIFHKLLYIDYSQFEAGILASLSNDKNLISLYNSDIYKDLAQNLFGDPNKRSDAKVIFYRYIYGDTTINKQAQQYFRKFDELQNFKEKIDKLMEEKGKIGTSYGNFRRKREEPVTWALSHVIQATASLIYKNALVRVAKEVDRAKFMIPMHDGTVYQIATMFYDKVKPQIEEIYLSEFRKVCPEINVRVNVKDVFD